MGMGEPLANYDAVKKALINLVNEDGMNFSRRRVTLSTCGLVPYMKRLVDEVKVKLAISLNAADDKTRSLLMPINKVYPLKSLIKACQEFPLPKGEKITFEYVLIEQVNDSDVDAQNLAELLSGIRAKINLIPLNPHRGIDMSPPSMERTLQFQDILLKRHFTTIIRKSRGRDISASCGQLSGDPQS
jgi:23S rRNA (adenine2503-C2)-methyltransferase